MNLLPHAASRGHCVVSTVYFLSLAQELQVSGSSEGVVKSGEARRQMDFEKNSMLKVVVQDLLSSSHRKKPKSFASLQ